MQHAGLRLQRRERRQLAVAASGGFGKPKEKTLSKQKACPCGSGQAFKDCCQRYHGGELPETPEKLMRSRFSAYVKGARSKKRRHGLIYAQHNGCGSANHVGTHVGLLVDGRPRWA